MQGMGTISKETVSKIAKLVKLDVSGSEEKLADNFSQTIKYIEILDELDTSKVAATYQVTGSINVFQDAITGTATLTKEQVLQNAPKKERGLVEAEAVFGEERYA